MQIEIKLKEIRLQRKLSLRGLAALSGVSKSTIADIENGCNAPNIDTICKLSQALEVGIEDIVACIPPK